MNSAQLTAEGGKLRLVCSVCEDSRRNLPKPDRDQALQRAIWQGMSGRQRMEMTRRLCNLVATMKRMKPKDGTV